MSKIENIKKLKKSQIDFFSNFKENELIKFQWVRTHNLKNIDIDLPKNKLITITGVSGSGKSSFAFHTLYKEWQFRYIESLSSYLRQFFNLWSRPDIDGSSWLSPAIAIEQNKASGNSRSTVWTLTEIDDYLRLLFAKLWQIYSYTTWLVIKAQNVDSILEELYIKFKNKKIYLIKESKEISNIQDFQKFVQQNHKKVEKWTWFTRYLILKNEQLEKTKLKKNENQSIPIEFFYLENPKIPENYFPIKLYAIFDRVTVEDTRKARMREDIIRILWEEKKFGIWLDGENSQKIYRYTDKNYCPVGNIQYPNFQSQNFSFNRAEWACKLCHGIWKILQVDMDKTIDPNSQYSQAILPRRDSKLGQTILQKLAEKYSMDNTKKRSDLPDWFKVVVLKWDNELIRINISNKQSNIKYQWIEEIIKDQYANGMLTVDFQAMLEMRNCPDCNWARLNKESLHVFLTTPKK